MDPRGNHLRSGLFGRAPPSWIPRRIQDDVEPGALRRDSRPHPTHEQEYNDQKF
jgi:hypothetical protein